MADLECPLQTAARTDPDLIALETSGRRISFRELDQWVTGTATRLAGDRGGATVRSDGARRASVDEAARLHERRIWQERRVVLWMENDWRMVVLVLAGIRAGVIMCPLSTRLPEVDDLLARVNASALVSDREGTAPDDLLDRFGQSGDVIHPPEQPATVVFTSGSSGTPKAALLSYGNHYFNAVGSNANIALGPGDRWLLSLPLYHVGGLAILFRCLLGRATILVRPDLSLHDAAARATHLSLVSTQLLRLMRSDAKLDHLKAVLLGGSAIPPALVDRAVERGLPIHTSYGLTEMASQVTTTAPGAARNELATSGRVLPHREIDVTTEGEILVRGRTRFLGYVDGGDVIEPFDEGGWYATGDVGRLEDGLLHVTGRLDNMFISGGENVMPEEVEALLSSRQDIRQAVVVSVEDEEFGRRPVAFVDTGENVPNSAEIEEWLEARLPRFKIPIRFFVWPKRDKLSSMKVDRGFFEREAARKMREQRL